MSCWSTVLFDNTVTFTVLLSRTWLSARELPVLYAKYLYSRTHLWTLS